MNFFKSILADDDPYSPVPEKDDETGVNSEATVPRDDGNSNDGADGWGFGDLIKTLTVQSESVIETYRKDLQEFGLGLRKESEIFRDTASRAVKDLPASLEATASAAHGALDGVLKSTADIIAKESLIFAPDGEPDTPDTSRSFTPSRYSWFHAQLSAIQNDLNIYCEEPENVEEYGRWKSGFELQDYKDEIEYLIGDNEALESMYKRVVPNDVDHETFWCRYFYRVDKLKQQERVRANLVRRANLVDDDDDELSWDFDDEEDGNGSDQKVKEANGVGENVGNDVDLNAGEKQEDLNGGSEKVNESGGGNVDDGGKGVVVDSGKDSSFDEPLGEKDVKSEEAVVADGKRAEEVKSKEAVDGETEEKVKSEEIIEDKNDGKVSMEMKVVSGMGNDASDVSSQLVAKEVEEMGWDEIEDTGSDDDKKGGTTTTHGGSPNKAELRKRLNVMEDEDLSWDIEDDDEPVKA